MTTLSEAERASAQDLARLSGDRLMHLQQEAARRLVRAKKLKDWIDGIIGLKYHEPMEGIRNTLQRQTGVVHLTDGDIAVSCDIPKRVEWDQRELQTIVKGLAEAKLDPTEYVDISYKVSESKYKAWPETLKAQFRKARTLKTGKPVYKLQPVEGGDR